MESSTGLTPSTMTDHSTKQTTSRNNSLTSHIQRNEKGRIQYSFFYNKKEKMKLSIVFVGIMIVTCNGGMLRRVNLQKNLGFILQQQSKSFIGGDLAKFRQNNQQLISHKQNSAARLNMLNIVKEMSTRIQTIMSWVRTKAISNPIYLKSAWLQLIFNLEKPDSSYQPDSYQISPTEELQNAAVTDEPQLVDSDQDPTIRTEPPEIQVETILNGQSKQHSENLAENEEEQLQPSNRNFIYACKGNCDFKINQNDITQEMTSAYIPNDPIPYQS